MSLGSIYKNTWELTDQEQRSQPLLCFSPLGKNYKIEFVLDNAVHVESRPFSLSAQTVPGGSGSSTSSGSSSSGHSKASSVGTPVQTLALVAGCLVGRLLLLEVFMVAVFI